MESLVWIVIVLIQQQLNSDWSDVIGVGPCDGIASRQTILSLVGALQAAEGVTTELITDLNSVNFGDATTNAFPGTLQNGLNTDYILTDIIREDSMACLIRLQSQRCQNFRSFMV